MTAPMLDLRHQWDRLRFRLEIVWRAAVTATLWLGIAQLHAALAGTIGQPVLLAVLVLAGITAVPLLYVQLALLVDAMSYLLFRELRVFPVFEEVLAQDAAQREAHPEQARRPSRLQLALITLADWLSPLSALTMWVFLVLLRAPTSTHVRNGTAKAGIRGAARTMRRIEWSFVDRAWHRRGLRAA